MNRYAHYSPMTDTIELRSNLRGQPIENLDTTEVAWWEPRPPATTRYGRRNRVAHRIRAIRRSPFAQHLRMSVRAVRWHMGAWMIVVLALAVAYATRGQFVTYTGLEDLPIGGTR